MYKYGIHYGYWSQQWDTDIISLVKRASGLGLNVLEINPPKYMMDLDKNKMKELKDVAEAHQVEVNICIGFPKEMDMSSEDASVRNAGIEYTKRMLEAAHFMGGTIISGILYSYWPATYPGLLDRETKAAYLERGLESVRKVIPVAEDYNIIYAIELVNRFEQYLLNGVDEGLEFVKKVESANCKLLLDTFHLNIEEDDLAEAIRKAGSYLAHIHACENNRKVPGQGNHIRWTEVFAALKDINYQGRIVMEPFVRMGGPVGRDLRIWRDAIDTSAGNVQEKLDQDLAEGLRFLKQLAQ